MFKDLDYRERRLVIDYFIENDILRDELIDNALDEYEDELKGLSRECDSLGVTFNPPEWNSDRNGNIVFDNEENTFEVFSFEMDGEEAWDEDSVEQEVKEKVIVLWNKYMTIVENFFSFVPDKQAIKDFLTTNSGYENEIKEALR